MIRFSDRMSRLKSAATRDLLKIAGQKDIINFGGGMPAPELFPVRELEECNRIVFEEAGEIALQYSTTEGWPRLREQIAQRLKRKNSISTDADHILITSGSHQGIDCAARAFCNPGDVILIERPSYLGALNAFKACEATCIEIPNDGHGMLLEDLERVLKTDARVRLIYVIPDFQNPTGQSWSFERRQQFMDIVSKYEIPVIEDNPYGELRYEGEYIPTLKSMDTKGMIIYLGTFSKILSPGIRLGWACANDEILSKMNYLEQSTTLQASTLNQMMVSAYMDRYDLDAHVEAIRQCYAKRCAIMCEAMESSFPDGVVFTKPKGGLFTWTTLPEGIDAKRIAVKCLERNVAYVPGDSFFPVEGNTNYFRMNFSNMPEERILKGISIIGEEIKAYYHMLETC